MTEKCPIHDVELKIIDNDANIYRCPMCKEEGDNPHILSTENLWIKPTGGIIMADDNNIPTKGLGQLKVNTEGILNLKTRNSGIKVIDPKSYFMVPIKEDFLLLFSNDKPDISKKEGVSQIDIDNMIFDAIIILSKEKANDFLETLTQLIKGVK